MFFSYNIYSMDEFFYWNNLYIVPQFLNSFLLIIIYFHKKVLNIYELFETPVCLVFKFEWRVSWPEFSTQLYLIYNWDQKKNPRFITNEAKPKADQESGWAQKKKKSIFFAKNKKKQLIEIRSHVSKKSVWCSNLMGWK